MSRSDNVGLSDLPDEILLIILKNLDNIDVLYSLFGIINERIDILLQDTIFTNNLNLVTRSGDDICPLDNLIFDRLCTTILPKIHHNVKQLILESMSMRRILQAGDYPNLTYLKIFNFERNIAVDYFTSKY